MSPSRLPTTHGLHGYRPQRAPVSQQTVNGGATWTATVAAVRTATRRASRSRGATSHRLRGSVFSRRACTSTVPAGQVIEEAATVTITVPLSARPGKLEAVVLAVAPPSQGGNIRMVNRVGLRVYLTISGASFPWRVSLSLSVSGSGSGPASGNSRDIGRTVDMPVGGLPVRSLAPVCGREV